MKRAFAWSLICLSLSGCNGANNQIVTSPADAQPQSATVAQKTVPQKTVAQPDGSTPGEQPALESPSANAAQARSQVTLKILTFDEIQALIGSYKGKVVVMDCWSTSCEPCMKEFPHLVALHRKYGPEKVACISFSFDYEGLDKPEDVRPKVLKFLSEQKATFDNVMSSEESDALYKKLQLASIPAIYVYDQKGQLVRRFDNEQITKPEEAFTYNDVEALVLKLLNEK